MPKALVTLRYVREDVNDRSLLGPVVWETGDRQLGEFVLRIKQRWYRAFESDMEAEIAELIDEERE